MKIKIFGEFESAETLELEVTSVPQLIPALRHIYGENSKLLRDLLNNEYYYFVCHSSAPDKFINLIPQVLQSDLSEFDTLVIVPKISGNYEGVAALIAFELVGAAGATAVAVATVIIEIAIAVAVSVALSYIAQLLSPTLSFDADPSQAQKLESSLFNGAPNIREQGGSVPLWIGECHGGGVLISAGISSYGQTI